MKKNQKNGKSSKKVVSKKPVAKAVKAEVAVSAPVGIPATPAPKVILRKVSTFKVQPLADRVIIKEDTESKEQTTASGIIIPISAQEDKGGKRGKVVAVGTGRIEKGEVISLAVQEGDTVLFQWGDKIKVDSEDYYIVRESEIMAIING